MLIRLRANKIWVSERSRHSEMKEEVRKKIPIDQMKKNMMQ